MKILLASLLLLISVFSNAADTWSEMHPVDLIYTYTSEDTLYVWLDGFSCPNTKKYFVIDPDHAQNAKQLISMVLAAKMSGTKINILYDPESNPTFCFFKGLQVE